MHGRCLHLQDSFLYCSYHECCCFDMNERIIVLILSYVFFYYIWISYTPFIFTISILSLSIIDIYDYFAILTCKFSHIFQFDSTCTSSCMTNDQCKLQSVPQGFPEWDYTNPNLRRIQHNPSSLLARLFYKTSSTSISTTVPFIFLFRTRNFVPGRNKLSCSCG